MESHVLTLQLGSFSNFIGSHFWNLQQEQRNVEDSRELRENQTQHEGLSQISTAALFSEHIIGHGVAQCLTHRPRLVVADFAGALGPSSTSNAISSVLDPALDGVSGSDTGCWDKGVEFLQGNQSANPNPRVHPYIQALNTAGFLSEEQCKQFDFENTVEYFTDFFTPLWSPQQQAQLLPGYFYGVDAFSSFSAGAQIAQARSPDSFGEHLEDKMRYQLELSDAIGAIHMLVDWLSGFSGIAIACVQWLKDQLPKTSQIVFNWAPPEPLSASNSRPHNAWSTLFSRAGGAVYLHSLLEEFQGTSGHGGMFSDFSLCAGDIATSPLNNEPENLAAAPEWMRSSAPRVAGSHYVASALPSLLLDCATSLYRAPQSRRFTAKDFYAGILQPNEKGALLKLHMSRATGVQNQYLQALQRKSSCIFESQPYWDAALPTFVGPPVATNALYSRLTSCTEFVNARGLPTSVADGFSAEYKQRFCDVRQPAPLPVPFPQRVLSKGTGKGDSYHQATVLTRWQADLEPCHNPVYRTAERALETVLKHNRTDAAELGIDRTGVCDTLSFLTELLSPDYLPED